VSAGSDLESDLLELRRASGTLYFPAHPWTSPGPPSECGPGPTGTVALEVLKHLDRAMIDSGLPCARPAGLGRDLGFGDDPERPSTLTAAEDDTADTTGGSNP